MADEDSSVVKRLIAAFVPHVPRGEARMLREHTANVQILTSLNQIRHTTFSWYVLGQAALLAALGTVRGTELLEIAVAGVGIGFSVVTFALVSRIVVYAELAEKELRGIESLRPEVTGNWAHSCGSGSSSSVALSDSPAPVRSWICR